MAVVKEPRHVPPVVRWHSLWRFLIDFGLRHAVVANTNYGELETEWQRQWS